MRPQNWSVRLLTLCLACLLASAAAQPAAAAAPSYTTLVVTDLHCSACAKKVAKKLYALPQVKEVRADVKKHTAYVVPKPGKQVSPRAMWEAVEAAGFKMVRMTGPGGSFTSKPRS